jgi:hypothetical protein
LAIFIMETAQVFKDPENSTRASWAAKALIILQNIFTSNLLGAVTKRYPVSLVTYSAISSANPTKVFNPVPTAVPP